MNRRSPAPGADPEPCWGESNALNFLLLESWSQVAQEARQPSFLRLLPRCSDCWLLGCTFSSFFKQASALRHAQMGLFSGGQQGYWSFSSLLLLQPCFCWAGLN